MAENQLTIRGYMSAPQVQDKLKNMFSDKRLMDGFIQSVISIAGSDDLLAVAEPRSVFNACLTAASLNLPINKNLGFAHIIGYKNNKKGITEAQFQLGARGFKELAQRTGQYLVINEGDVRAGELVGRDRLTGELEFVWCEDDAERNELPTIGYFSYFKLKNGFRSIVYMSREEVEAHARKFSQSYKLDIQKNWTSSPWSKDFGAMALKTVTKRNISKNGPLSVELQRAIEADQAVIGDDNKPNYIDGNDLATVSNSDDEEDAIVSANATAPENADTGTDAEQPTTTEQDVANVEQTFPGAKVEAPAAPATPAATEVKLDKKESAKSVKERAAEFVAKGKAANAKAKAEAEKGQQASLVDENAA
jgi:recombination protein RecT